MKKIMVLITAAIMISSASVAAFAKNGPVYYEGHPGNGTYQGSLHGGYHGYHGYRGGYRHYGHYNGNRNCCYGGVYGDDSDDAVLPFVAGGIFGAVLGNVLNR